MSEKGWDKFKFESLVNLKDVKLVHLGRALDLGLRVLLI